MNIKTWLCSQHLYTEKLHMLLMIVTNLRIPKF